jgi:hypothetical protein
MFGLRLRAHAASMVYAGATFLSCVMLDVAWQSPGTRRWAARLQTPQASQPVLIRATIGDVTAPSDPTTRGAAAAATVVAAVATTDLSRVFATVIAPWPGDRSDTPSVGHGRATAPPNAPDAGAAASPPIDSSLHAGAVWGCTGRTSAPRRQCKWSHQPDRCCAGVAIRRDRSRKVATWRPVAVPARVNR